MVKLEGHQFGVEVGIVGNENDHVIVTASGSRTTGIIKLWTADGEEIKTISKAHSRMCSFISV